MPRKPKPWLRKQTKCWYVTIGGRQHNLDSDKKEAEKLFHKLMAEDRIVIRRDSVVVIIDAFLEWLTTHRAAARPTSGT